MITKIGNKIAIIIASIFLFFSPINSSINNPDLLKIEIVNRQKQPISIISIEEPFWINIKISGIFSGKLPDIPGLDKLTLLSTQKSQNISFSSNNSGNIDKSTRQIIFGYLVKAEKIGDYIIGPIEVEIDGKKHNTLSSSILAKLQDKQDSFGQDNSNTKKPIAFLELDLNKKKIIIGEDAILNLRFYYLPDKIQLKQVNPVQIDGIKASPWNLKRESQEVKYENNYNVIELQSLLESDQVGTFNIPPIIVNYINIGNIQNHQNSIDIFSQIINISQASFNPKAITTPAIELIVEDMPANNKKVQVVGEYTDFNIEFDRLKAQQSEGIILKLKVTGNGNLDRVNPPKLIIPNCFKYYQSKAQVLKKDNQNIYIFEYILQGMEVGNFEILPQEFIFFDLKTKSYKTLKTHTTNLSILSLDNQPNNQINNQANNQINNQTNALSKKLEQNINTKLLILILLFLLILILIIKIYVFDKYIYFKDNNYLIRTAFKDATYKINKYEQQKNVQLAPIFITLFSKILHVSEHAISLDYICNILKQKAFSSEEIEAWKFFFIGLLNKEFGDKSKNSNNQEWLFEQARLWLIKLKRAI